MLTNEVRGVPWAGLEVRHLQALLAVAEEGTFSRAAQSLGYTQSAVSQQVRALERLVGAELFERRGGPKPVSLTPEGEALVGHARSIMGLLLQASADLRALTGGDKGLLRVGTIQSVGRRILPDLLRRHRVNHPDVEIQLAESQDPYVLLARMDEGELDLMFVPLPIPDGRGVVTQHVLDDPFVLLAPAGSPEAERSSISFDEIVRLPLIGYRSDWCRGIVAERFAAAGHAPRYIFESDDNPTIQGLVGVGGAYAVTTLLSVDQSDPNTVAVPVHPPVEPRRVAVLYPAHRRHPATLLPFVETVTAVCGDLVQTDDWTRSRVDEVVG